MPAASSIFRPFPVEFHTGFGMLTQFIRRSFSTKNSHQFSGCLAEKETVSIVSDCCRSNANNGFMGSISKSVAFTLFWIVIGLCPLLGYLPPALALRAISDILWRKKGKIVEEETAGSWKDHEYTGYTESLLDSVSRLLRVMEAVKAGKRDVEDLKAALKEVKSKSSELQNEILGGLYAELRELRKERGKLANREVELLESALNMKQEQDELLKLSASPGGGANDELKGKIISWKRSWIEARRNTMHYRRRLGRLRIRCRQGKQRP